MVEGIFEMLLLRWGLLALALVTLMQTASAQDFLGPEACQKCHKPEFTVWEDTPHAALFDEFRRNRDARDIVKEVGDRNPKKSEVCILCHYTALTDASGEPDPVAGPSCESCHGAASDWIEIHNNYGGQGVTAEQESAEHEAQRINDAAAAGMIWPHMTYDATRNCFTCHGLNNDALDVATLEIMLDAGHPVNGDFEYIAYSQGQVRHRFYPPDRDVNQELTAAESAEWYLVGQAASLVAATEGSARTSHPDYVAAMEVRIARATEALSRIDVGAAVLADPTEANAEAFALAIAGQDHSAAVSDLVPTEYK
mgnify:CR=1 FL=1